MPKSKGENTDEGEGNVAKGLVDLGIDDEKDEKKFLEIVNEEEKCVKEFIQTSNKKILESECDQLALVYSMRQKKIYKFRQRRLPNFNKERKESAN